MASEQRREPNVAAGYASGPLTKPPDWHGLVAFDVLLNNLSTGLFLTEALGELVRADLFQPLAALAYPIALVLLLGDLVCLVLDLGDPLRFHHMLRVFKPTSPMSLGTWCLTVYSLPLTIVAALSLWPAAGGSTVELVRKTALVLGLLPALGSALYKGVLLSTNSQPGWRDARWMGGYLTNSALMLGCAELLALSVLVGQDRATAVTRPTLVLLVVLNSVFMLLLFVELRPALRQIYPAPQRGYVGLATLCVALFAPLGLLLAGGSPVVLLVAVALLAVGNLMVRFVIIKIPQALSG